MNLVLRQSMIIFLIYLQCMFLFSLLHCFKFSYLWRKIRILECANFSSSLICISEGSTSPNIRVSISNLGVFTTFFSFFVLFISCICSRKIWGTCSNADVLNQTSFSSYIITSEHKQRNLMSACRQDVCPPIPSY